MAGKAAVEVGKDRASAFVRLDRPGQLNAIDDAMRARIAAALPGFIRDPEVYALLIESAVDNIFSAGGDLRELARLVVEDPAAVRRSFAAEYRLNWALECFAKPTVALIDGLAVGSGVGLTQYGTHRVAGERYKFAMPETAIGFFPDVGVISVLARLPRGIGVYLALTGRRVGRADALRLGLVTHCIDRTDFATIRAGLADADTVDDLLDTRHRDPGPGELAPIEAAIEDVFATGTLAEMVGRLAALEARAGVVGEWAAGVRQDLARFAPMSLAATLAHLRRVGDEPLDQTLVRDYRLACRMVVAPDFAEGIRAMLVDKDRTPRWRPARIEEVGDEVVAQLLAPLPEGEELVLASRAEMQNLRSGG